MNYSYISILALGFASLVSCKESASRSTAGDDFEKALGSLEKALEDSEVDDFEKALGSLEEALGDSEGDDSTAEAVEQLRRVKKGVDDGDIDPLIAVMGEGQMKGLIKTDLLFNGDFQVGDVRALVVSAGASGMEHYYQTLTKKLEESYDARGFSNIKSNLSNKVPGEALNFSGLHIGLSLRDAIILLKGKGYRWEDSSGNTQDYIVKSLVNTKTNYIEFDQYYGGSDGFFNNLYRLMNGPLESDDWDYRDLVSSHIRKGDDVYRFRFGNEPFSDDFPRFGHHYLEVSINPKNLLGLEELEAQYLRWNLIFKFGYLVGLEISGLDDDDETHQLVKNAWLKSLKEIREKDFNVLLHRRGEIVVYDGSYIVRLQSLASKLIAAEETGKKLSILKKINPDATLESLATPAVVESPATPAVANDETQSKYSGNGNALQSAKDDLAKVDRNIEAERERWKNATAVINKLTNFKRTPVREGSSQYYKCVEASKIIRQVEAGAPKLKAEKARLEKLIQSLEGE